MQLPDARINSYFLTVFGKPLRVLTVESERSAEPSVAQALHAINGETINQKLRATGGLVETFSKLGVSDEMVINHLYNAALSRPPSQTEMKQLLSALGENNTSRNTQATRRQAIEDLAWAVLTSKEFLFNH